MLHINYFHLNYIMTFVCNEDQINIAKYLHKKTYIPIICIFKLLRQKHILVNNKKVNKNYKLAINDIIYLADHIEIEKRKYNNLAPDNLFESCLLYETSDICILNKPYNLATQRGTNILYSIDDAIQKYCLNNNILPYHLVHRIDKDTSGILVVAKNRKIAISLSKLFHNRKISKTYHAILCGKVEQSHFIVNAPIEKIDLKCIVSEKGKEAITEFTLIKYININNNIYSLMSIKPLTGRTHQIRVHSMYAGYSILGDTKYNGDTYFRLALHAHSIQIFNQIFTCEAEFEK